MNVLKFTIKNDFDLFFKKFINLLMKDGKKTKASKIFFKMLLVLKKKIQIDLEKNSQSSITLKSNQVEFSKKKNSIILNSELEQKKIPADFILLQILFQAIENITPSLEVRKVRVAGSTYLVPAILSKKKQETLALKWIIESAQKRQKNSRLDFFTCLADEILDASKKLGQSRQKRDELHRSAQANRAYVRYRWW